MQEVFEAASITEDQAISETAGVPDGVTCTLILSPGDTETVFTRSVPVVALSDITTDIPESAPFFLTFTVQDFPTPGAVANQTLKSMIVPEIGMG